MNSPASFLIPCFPASQFPASQFPDSLIPCFPDIISPMQKFDTLFFDLDATLYPTSNGLWKVMKERISGYMIERMELPSEKVSALREEYYRKYGTTLAGLQRHHQVNVKDYLDYVHGVPLENYINPNPELRSMLESLPQKLWVFTNSDRPHTERVLAVLGIEDLFEGISDVYALDFDNKPSHSAYEKTLALAGNPDPEKCVMFDDLLPNLIAAKEMGLYTVLVNEGESHPKVNVQVQDLLELPEKLPELWEG